MTNRIFRYLRKRDEGETGQSLVEIAVTLPLMMVILVGGAEMARLAYEAMEVTNAAHAGAEYGAQSLSTLSDTSGIRLAASDDASDISSLTTSSSYAVICSDGTVPADSTTGGSNTDCATSSIEDVLTVTTTATFDPLIHLPGLPTTYTVNGSAVQKVLSY